MSRWTELVQAARNSHNAKAKVQPESEEYYTTLLYVHHVECLVLGTPFAAPPRRGLLLSCFESFDEATTKAIGKMGIIIMQSGGHVDLNIAFGDSIVNRISVTNVILI